MNIATIFGVLTSLLGLSGLIFVLVGDSHFPVSQWPHEAFQSLVFSFVWSLGVRDSVGYLASAIVVIVVLVVCFAIGYKLSRCVFSGKQK